MEPFIGQIQAFGFNFAPRGWAKCDGQLLPISQNTALFSLLGTTYGGDGRTTFALPDLRGRLPMHQGQGAGLSNHPIGQQSGQEQVTLTSVEMPSHNHSLHGIRKAGQSAGPKYGVVRNDYAPSDGTPNVSLGTDTVMPTGGGQPHNNMQPYLAVNYCIALEGAFPARN
ncbi:MAG: phage tail protein [Chitinophagales bacterium]